MSFRRNQISREVLWGVLEKETNARYQALDTLTFHVHSLKMSVGFGKRAEKSIGRPLSVIAQFKRSVLEVKAEENCLANTLVIAVAKMANDPNFIQYRMGRKKILPKIRDLLQA